MKILIVRFSSIGDIVLTSPVIRCLKLQLAAEIHFLCKSSFTSLMETNPYVDQVIGFDDDWQMLLKNLKVQAYDLIIDLHKNARTLRVKTSLKTRSLSFNKINIQKWLKVNLKLDFLPKKHLVDRYFEGIKSLGVENDGKGLDFFIKKNVHKDLPERVCEILDKDFICLAFGAAHFTKSIPEQKLTEIFNVIDSQILLLGGPGESSTGEIMENRFPGKIVNTCGMLSFQGSASLIEKCKGLITVDTGMMHIGAALKKAMIVFWGSTIPEFGMYPYGISADSVRFMENKDVSCRPCSKIGYQKCPRSHFKCMDYRFGEKLKEYVVELNFL